MCALSSFGWRCRDAVQVEVKAGSPLPSQSAPRPPTLLFPRELWPLVSAGSHRVWLVVASWLQWATTTCSGIVVGGRPLCPPLAPPTTTHPLKPQAKPRSDLEGRPRPPASGSLVSEWPRRAGCGAVWPLLQPTAVLRVFLGGAGGRAEPQPSCLWLPAVAPHRP